MVLVLKNLPANVGDLRDTGLIPGWGRSLGEGNGFFLEKEITPVIFPGESNGQRSPVGYGPYDCKESNSTEVTSHRYRLVLCG